MKRKQLGTSGIEVSVLCLGTMTWGCQNSEAEAHQQMDYALERGINFFDTAELYAIPPSAETYGRTEEMIGSWFNKTGKREEVILASKVAGPTSLPWIRGTDNNLDRANVTAALDASLKRLQTDYIDLYQLHWPARTVNNFGTLDYGPDMWDIAATAAGAEMLETLQVLQDMVTAGKIRHVGLSNETPWGIMRFLQMAKDHGLPRMQSVQNAYNLINRTHDIGMAEVCMQEDIGLLAYSPTARGRLSGKYLGGALPEGSAKAIDTRPGRYDAWRSTKATQEYVALADKAGLDPCRMAIAFCRMRPWVTSTIIGATNLDQLRNNIDAHDLVLDETLLTAINEIHLDNPNPTEAK